MKKITKSIVLALSGVCFIFTPNIYAQTANVINTVVGNGYNLGGFGGYSGDGGPAISAELASPGAIAFDNSGNMYFTDGGNNVIRKVNTSGIITTVAGNGYGAGMSLGGGYTGDGGSATSAELNSPSGVAVDILGNIYIADNSNNVIRKVNSSGIISTFAGDGTRGIYGVGIPATDAELNQPNGIALDGAGNLYIADQLNNLVRMVNTSGIISTIAGNGIGGYSGDGAPATAAELSGPSAVAIDNSENIFIADFANSVVRMVNTSGIISTFAGTGTSSYSGDGGLATLAELDYPTDVKLDDTGNVFIADNRNEVIRKVNTNGIISTYAGNHSYGYGFSGDGGAATASEFHNPYAIAVNGMSNIFIADAQNNRVREVQSCTLVATPGPISGNSTVCSGSTQIYSITPVIGATNYTWTLPSGWTGSSTSTSITVTTGSTGGSIIVGANNNCAISPVQTLTVIVPTQPVASICYVSVDTSSTYNEIFWDKSSLDTLAIDSFQIYRQVLTNYVEVGSVAANTFPSFIDHGSTPNSNSSLYEIGVLDTCGQMGIDSILHDQTILLQASLGVGNVVNLSWNAYIGATINYYRILRDSTGTGNWQKLDSVSSSILAYTDLHPPVSNNLQYVITTDWNLSCVPGLAPIRHGLFYSFSSYSNRKKVVVTGVNIFTDLSSAIEVYPNPAANTLFISINQPIDGNIAVFNVLGEKVYVDVFSSENQNTTKQIQLSGLSSGVYILKIESNGQTLIKKFVKI